MNYINYIETRNKIMSKNNTIIIKFLFMTMLRQYNYNILVINKL